MKLRVGAESCGFGGVKSAEVGGASGWDGTGAGHLLRSLLGAPIRCGGLDDAAQRCQGGQQGGELAEILGAHAVEELLPDLLGATLGFLLKLGPLGR